ncbi:hypothetical protein CRG98_008870, partial [Punica granatum]
NPKPHLFHFRWKGRSGCESGRSIRDWSEPEVAGESGQRGNSQRKREGKGSTERVGSGRVDYYELVKRSESDGERECERRQREWALEMFDEFRLGHENIVHMGFFLRVN